MKKIILTPNYTILNNIYLRKLVILLPIIINTIIIGLMGMIRANMVDMKVTDFMVGLFFGCLIWFVMWLLIIIKIKNRIARHNLYSQMNGDVYKKI